MGESCRSSWQAVEPDELDSKGSSRRLGQERQIKLRVAESKLRRGSVWEFSYFGGSRLRIITNRTEFMLFVDVHQGLDIISKDRDLDPGGCID